VRDNIETGNARKVQEIKKDKQNRELRGKEKRENQKKGRQRGWRWKKVRRCVSSTQRKKMKKEKKAVGSREKWNEKGLGKPKGKKFGLKKKVRSPY